MAQPPAASRPTAATPDFVAGDQARHEITIDFEHLDEKLRAQPQAGLDERERQAVEQFARLQVEPSAIVAVVMALVSLANARRRVGLSPRQCPGADIGADPQTAYAAARMTRCLAGASVVVMESVTASTPAISAKPPGRGAAAAPLARDAAERDSQHEEEQLDEALLQSFPASDPPSSWAGP